MTLGTLAFKNLAWNRFRTTLTVLGVAIAIIAFLLLRTFLSAWNVGVEHATQDRIGTRHKVTFVMTLPRRYVEDVRNVPGIRAATSGNWFGGKNPRREREFFATIAVESQSFFEVFDDVSVPAAEREAWVQNRRGAIVGDVLAKKFRWRVGDRVTLVSDIFPGNWEFKIEGIYTATRQSMDRAQFFFHWDYLNEAGPEWNRDRVGWIMSRIDDPRRAASISTAVDRVFADRDVQTLSMSERAMNQSFLGMFSAVLTAINVVSIVILLIMMLILGNTIAMGVRERTSEYGAMRAIGFRPGHIAAFVLGEGMAIGLLGGALGLLLGFPFVEWGVGRYIEENLGNIIPYFRVPPAMLVAAVVLAVVLGAVAAVLPAIQASRLRVVDAIRRVG